jgi:hypothetical protein
MIKPIDVILSDGYQLCGTCGEMMLNGDKAQVLENYYAHPECAAKNPPEEWKLVRRVDSALVTRKPGSPEWYEVQLYAVPGEGEPREDQFTLAKDDEGNETNEPVIHTGAKWNGSVYQDCRGLLEAKAVLCDRPLVARLMEEVAAAQIMREERANLYVGWDKEKLESDKQSNKQPFVDVGDMRESVGINVTPEGHLYDDLPDENTPQDATE